MGLGSAQGALGNDSVTPRRLVPIIVHILLHGQVQLLEIAEALGLDGGCFCARQGRQEHRRKNGDDRNDHEQLDERKSGGTFPGHAATQRT